MTLEAKLVYELEPAVYFACALATAIPKGTLVKISDEGIVAAAAADNDPVIGITAEEKVATTDGKITVAVYMRGVFKVFVGAAGATVGAAAINDAGTGAQNEVVDADVNSENIIGRFLGTASDTESVMMLLNPFSINVA